MRTLTAILMLCLPMAAMGETYICKTEKRAYLGKTFSDVSESNLTDWVIDTDSGMRRLSDESIYVGECKKSELGIICSNGSLYYFHIRLSDRVFTASLHAEGRSVTSWVGTCTEI